MIMLRIHWNMNISNKEQQKLFASEKWMWETNLQTKPLYVFVEYLCIKVCSAIKSNSISVLRFHDKFSYFVVPVHVFSIPVQEWFRIPHIGNFWAVSSVEFGL